MNPTLEQLARYAAQELERGVPEVALSASLRESGWTPEWINAAISTAKQRAVPAVHSSLNIPEVRQQTQSQPAELPTISRPSEPLVRSVTVQPKKVQTTSRSLKGLQRALVVVVALLGLTTLGLSGYRIINYIQHSAQQKVVRDAERREDLSVLLNDLSDYFVVHRSYPTRTQLNTTSFIKANGFTSGSISDPKWSADNATCAEADRATFTTSPQPDCYAYEVATSKDNGVCNNGSVACTKVKVSIWLEVDKKAYSVTLDKNSQVD